MRQKKLMLLGGIRFLLPVIKSAHELGYYVITCDYIPDNIAHKYSDEYVNASIVDKEAVLKIAREKKIDGIMSFGVDPGVISAAYVQQQMRLPAFGPYESVEILQNKDKFRKFLRDNSFNTPKFKVYSLKQEALEDVDKFDYPIIVKPTDSAGSKGVMRVNSKKELDKATDYAFAHSRGNHIIIEQFIEKLGCSSSSESFSKDGELKFVSFNSQRFDLNAINPYVPAAHSWPSTMTKEQENYLANEIQRLLTLLHMQTSVYNIETRIGTDNKPYIMELSPRGGGNRLCEMLRYATGVDLIKACVCGAVGDEIPVVEQRPYVGNWAEVILHADTDGTFQRIEISNDVRPYVIEEDLWVKKGDHVSGFKGANDAIGTLVLNFDSQEQLEEKVTNQKEWLKVIIK